jgi:hypothetical protein
MIALVARLAPIGDDMDLLSFARFVDEPLGCLVYPYPLRA